MHIVDNVTNWAFTDIVKRSTAFFRALGVPMKPILPIELGMLGIE